MQIAQKLQCFSTNGAKKIYHVKNNELQSLPAIVNNGHEWCSMLFTIDITKYLRRHALSTPWIVNQFVIFLWTVQKVY